MSDHITITPAQGTWVVRAGGAVLGETTGALELREGDHAPVIYFPRGDIAMAFLDGSDKTSHCPYKGDASYFSVVTKSRTLQDAVCPMKTRKRMWPRSKGIWLSRRWTKSPSNVSERGSGMLLCRGGGEGAIIGLQRIDVEQRAQQFGRRIGAEGDHRDEVGMGLVEQRQGGL